ncbi:MAG: TraR/DksA C4-type zinc finger protein [Patescibacteria group bacterium]|nr:TraR/DksA C4-type zinc finger protein [Patescibacteria group bacterium]
MLSQEDIKEFEEQLLKQKMDFEEQLNKIAKKDKKIKDNYRTSFPNYGREDQDNAEEVEVYDSTLSLEGQLELELRKVNIALDKIEQDKGYGLCENCGKEIGIKRLKAYPWAGKCITCAKQKNHST